MGSTSVKTLEKQMLDVYRKYTVYFTLHGKNGDKYHSALTLCGMSPDCVIGKLKKFYKEHPDDCKDCKMLAGPIETIQVHHIAFIKVVSVLPGDWDTEADLRAIRFCEEVRNA